jgi:nucleoside-diphosphate-sugar epimerase
MSIIFVTGASGFVGGAITRHLVGKGHQVRAMSRSEKSDDALRKIGAIPVRCALNETHVNDLFGCEYLIHCAAKVEEWGELGDYWRTNVTGTKNLLEAAEQAQVKRFVHVGTEAALFHGQHIRDADESYPLALDSPFPYAQTKAHAEAAVKRAADISSHFETIVIRPRLVWGPGDQTILPIIVEMAAKGRFTWVNRGRNMTSSTHIDNLVHALELALTRGTSGESYFVLDGPPTEFRDFVTRYAATAGVTLPDKSIPSWVAKTAAFILEPLWHMMKSKTPPPITRFGAAMLASDSVLLDAKARADLGYAPVISVDDGMKALTRAA